MKRQRLRPPSRLVVNPIACDGIGLCMHFAGHLIHADSWGFPMIGSDPVDDEHLAAARTAVRGCPRKALTLKAYGAEQPR